MRFGTIDNLKKLDGISFELPQINSVEYSQGNPLKKNVAEGQQNLFLGAPAWGIKEWVGKIYPAKTNPRDFLRLYSQIFNSIELNSIYYTLPAIETIHMWKSQVPEYFKFAPKITKQISHLGGMNNQKVVHEYFDTIRNFEEKLGLIFLQLNESFAPNRINELESFIKFLPKDLDIAIEFRHEEWFKNNIGFELLAANDISTIITDVAGRRDVLHMNLTSPNLIIRFVGNNLHKSDYTRIDTWVDKIIELKDSNLKSIYFFIHEVDDVMAPEIADYFIEKAKEKGIVNFERIQFQMNAEDSGQLSLI